MVRGVGFGPRFTSTYKENFLMSPIEALVSRVGPQVREVTIN